MRFYLIEKAHISFMQHQINPKHKINPLLKLALLLAVLLLSYWLLLPIVPKTIFWPSFALISIAWFAYQYNNNKRNGKRINKALKIGLIIVAANLFVNYYFGFLQGAYTIEPKYTLLFVLGNPIELLTGSFFGGAGWFLLVPKKFDRIYSAADVALLALFGMAAEIMLIGNGLLFYLTVDSLNAFLTYAGLWIILHFVYYKVLK
jgi:energy-coupling factor transporter transmembrane protein EcfT